MLVGAFAKSAQLPLHTWLPDAMEGPTPVSALIHAATMVTAGVYLIARMHPLFLQAPTAADISAFLGLATLIFAATVALAVTDLKRIIAYSTISQIGYMVVGVSIGAYAAGLFHLMSHAFFKALLFMAAGSVIAAMAGTQNIDRMSGFRRALPFTSALLIVGALSLAAFPGTSGFFSKDEILAFAGERGGFYWILAIGGYVGAFLTAVYAFRIVFRVVYGEPCPEARELEQGHLAHAEPQNPLTGRRRTRTSASPARSTTSPSARGRWRSRWRSWACWRSSAATSRSRGWTTFWTRSWSRPSRTRPFPGSTCRPRPPGPSLGIGGALSLLGIATAYYVYRVAPQTPSGCDAGLTPSTPSWSTSGTSTSSTTRSSTGR